jgi:pimeloyl-ACP methyl ester carboxylesterase
MKTSTRRRARFFLILVLCLAVAASAAGLVISRQGGSQAQAAVPGSASTRADLGTMQAALNSGSVPRQAALLARPVRLMPGSGPVFAAGTTVTILPGTFRTAGKHATVRASVSDGTAVTLGLYLTGGHWRLYGATAGARTSATVTGQPARAQLAAAVSSAGSDALAAGTYQGVILVHGFGESASNWDSSGMSGRLRAIPGTRVLKFDYAQVNKKWVSDPAIGPALADYIHQVAKASGRPVIVVGFSMGGLATRWAANEGARAGDIAMVITIGTPNTGSLLGDGYNILCATVGLGVEIFGSDFCTQWQAASAMSVLNPEILTLPKLPASIPFLHAIAGEQTIVYKIGFAQAEIPLHGDGVVFTGSALDKRPGSMNDTYEPVASQLVPGDKSAWHLKLTSNPKVQQKVAGYISGYLRDHPVSSAQSAPGHPSWVDDQSPVNVVYKFYDALNAHDYTDARKQGLPVLGGTDWASWVHNRILQGKASAYVTGQDMGGGKVRVSVTITWKGGVIKDYGDGTVKTYAGTYTVGETSWIIETADLSDMPDSAPALGGEAYWLAGGGQWGVHDMQLRISQGPSGLTGKETWNAGPCVSSDPTGDHCWGSAGIAFTSQPDGSLTGTYTTDASYVTSGGTSVSNSQSDPGAPQKGQAITLIPVAPHHARAVYGSNSPRGFIGGNTNLCQSGYWTMDCGA